MGDTQRRVYLVAGVLLALLGVVIALGAPDSDVVHSTVEGISVFAVLYLIAQAAERVSEWVISLLSLLPESPEKGKQEALRELRSANSTINGNPDVADFGAVVTVKEEKEEKVDAARLPITFLASGLSFALCAFAVNRLNYGLLEHLGTKNVDGDIDRLLTALAAAGGTKALHELIGRMQKAKESSEKGD